MEFGLKGASRVCRGRHGEVGIVEFGRNRAHHIHRCVVDASHECIACYLLQVQGMAAAVTLALS